MFVILLSLINHINNISYFQTRWRIGKRWLELESKGKMKNYILNFVCIVVPKLWNPLDHMWAVFNKEHQWELTVMIHKWNIIIIIRLQLTT